jgi:hypothetical protein
MDHSELCTFALVNKNVQKRAIFMAQERKDCLSKYIEASSYENILPISEQYTAWHKYGSACTFVRQEEQMYLFCNLVFNCVQFSNDKAVLHKTPITSYTYVPLILFNCNPEVLLLYPAKNKNFSKAAKEGWARYKCSDENKTELSLPFFDQNNNASLFMTSDKSDFIQYITINNQGLFSRISVDKEQIPETLNYHMHKIKPHIIDRPPKRFKK